MSNKNNKDPSKNIKTILWVNCWGADMDSFSVIHRRANEDVKR